MTTKMSRSTDKRAAGSLRASGQWLLGLLIALAFVASVMMIWSDQLSIRASVAVIAALWAAVLGAIGVTRFRRQAEMAEAKGRDLRLVYELQLEREIAARRQYEMDIEAQIRADVAAEAGSDLRELQAQIAALRASLEAMMGHELPDDRIALPNERLRELSSSMSGYAPDDGLLAAADFASTAPPAPDGRHYPTPQGGRNDLTEIIPVVEDEPQPYVNPFAGPESFTVAVEDAYAAVEEYPVPAADEAYTAAWTGAQAYSAGSYGAAEAAAEQSAGVESAGVESAGVEPAVRESATDAWVTLSAESAPTESGGRRRGEGQHESGISAAELLNQLRGSRSGEPPR